MMGLQYPREHREWVDAAEDRRELEYEQGCAAEDFNQVPAETYFPHDEEAS